MKYLLDKMDFDDIEISYIGEEEAIDNADNNEDLNEDCEVRRRRFVWFSLLTPWKFYVQGKTSMNTFSILNMLTKLLYTDGPKLLLRQF